MFPALMFVLGAVLAAASTPLMLRLLIVMRQRNADEDAQEAIEADAIDNGASVRDAWAASKGVTAPTIPGPVVHRPRWLAVGQALSAGTLSAVFAAFLPLPLVPLFVFLSVIGTLMAVSDLRTYRLPNILIYPSYAATVGLLLIAGSQMGEWPVTRVLLSAGAWGVFFGALWLFSGGQACGLGDVKLAPICGAVLGALGWGASGFGWFAGLFIGAVVGIAVVSGSWGAKYRHIPFGPWMLAGVAVGALVGEPLIMGWLRAIGLT